MKIEIFSLSIPLILKEMLRSVENKGSTIFLKTLNRNDMEKNIMTLIKKYQTIKEVVYEDDEHD